MVTDNQKSERQEEPVSRTTSAPQAKIADLLTRKLNNDWPKRLRTPFDSPGWLSRGPFKVFSNWGAQWKAVLWMFIGPMITVPVATLIAFALISGLYFLIELIASGWGSTVVYGFIGILVVVWVGIAKWLKHGMEQVPVRLTNGGETLHIGRVDQLLIASEGIAEGLLASLILGQVVLLYYTSNHLGLGRDLSLVDSSLLTLDNLLHGILFDVLEMYHFRFGPVITKMSTWTTTVFLLFRLGFDAVVLLHLYLIFQRFTIGKILGEIPAHVSQEELLKFLETCCAANHQCLSRFGNEFVFLAMSERYLRSDFAWVRQVSQQFPRMRVDEDVRKLFVHPQTEERLFEPMPTI